MKATPTPLPGLLLIQTPVFADARGSFRETWSEERYRRAGLPPFVQDNVSVSRGGVLRGLHYQEPHAQGKLVSVLRGRVLDVAVDIRHGSPTFGEHFAVELSDADGRQLWVPAGFAHGFAALTDEVVFSYRCTDYYHPQAERAVRWSDPALGIAWPLTEPLLSAKDEAAPLLAAIPPEQLPRWTGA